VHLRAILGEVGMVSIPSMFPVSKVQDAFDDDGNAIDGAYVRRIQRFLDELEWYAGALKEARKKGVPYE
jgi:NAD(P)H-dependent FMN reductase